MDIILWHRILEPYEMAVDELILKFRHMKEEYERCGRYCPIEHVTGRVKSISSILDKMQKKNIPMERMEQDIEDIAGIRIICQFVEDIERVARECRVFGRVSPAQKRKLVEALQNQGHTVAMTGERVANMISRRTDMEVREIKDYVRNQKESGYRSYHMIVDYEVNTIDGPKKVQAEIQIRTMAMDFWATTEHSLQYKYQGKIPERVGARLSNAANAIISLDSEMSAVRDEIMDAQLSSKMKYSLVEDIVSTIENMYSLTTTREVEKIQDEFYRVYQQDDMEELIRYHDQLDLIAQAYKAQSNRQGEGIKKSED